MPAHRTHVPWSQPGTWHEANAALMHLMRHNHLALDVCRMLANRLKADLTAIFPLMERLCRQTCTSCADICCRRAWVWIDFRDLLFLHLAEVAVPGRQLLGATGKPCRYIAAGGCRLARIQRPFVCTWYLCPAQTRFLDRRPDEKRWLFDAVRRIKDRRRDMEERYIQATR